MKADGTTIVFLWPGVGYRVAFAEDSYQAAMALMIFNRYMIGGVSS
jgi:hypothetical protein